LTQGEDLKINEAAAKKAINSLRRIGNWELIDRLGQGGFGTVLKAQKTLVNGDIQLAAIKLINPSQMVKDPNAGRRFAHEYEMMKRLDSPYVSRLLDSGQEPIAVGGDVLPLLWFATELIPGENLHDEISQHGILDKAQWLELAHDLLTAVAETHEKGVVHKDIKPSNIMRHARRSILVDFGIGSYVSVEDPGDEGAYTLGFCAPEQIDGKIDATDFGYEVDIFASGSTLVYAATGLMPWDIKETGVPSNEAELRAMRQLKVRQLNADMKAKAPRLSGLDQDQLQLVQKMLVYAPEKRASAAELLASVKSLLPDGSLRKQENTNVRPVRSVPQVNRDLLAEFKMGFHKQQAPKAAASTGPTAPAAQKVQGPWPSMLTSAFLALFGPLGTGLRFSYLEQNRATHPLARMERQIVAILFAVTSFGLATPFIGWSWFKTTKKKLDLMLAALALSMILGIFALFAVGTIAGEGSDFYSLTTSIASVFLLLHIVLAPIVAIRVPKTEKPKEEDKVPEKA
jgi:serine/threonine protein kinase